MQDVCRKAWRRYAPSPSPRESAKGLAGEKVSGEELGEAGGRKRREAVLERNSLGSAP